MRINKEKMKERVVTAGKAVKKWGKEHPKEVAFGGGMISAIVLRRVLRTYLFGKSGKRAFHVEMVPDTTSSDRDEYPYLLCTDMYDRYGNARNLSQIGFSKGDATDLRDRIDRLINKQNH